MLTPELTEKLRPSPQSDLPKVRQLYLSLYACVTEGEPPYRQRLPASRELARQLGVGRNLVVSVYNQLCDEGILSSDGRRGTVVVHQVQTPVANTASGWSIADRARHYSGSRNRHTALAPGQPDTQLFPRDAWRRALQVAARLPASLLAYQDASLPALQQAIARYLASYRSLVVTPEQIVVTSSTRQSLLLAAALFADHGDTAWIEAPGYAGAVDAFAQMGLKLRACRVDEQGMVPANKSQPPALIYTTPCFQYPTGVPLSASRREQLLALSAASGAVIFEDDYDSEFRDDSQPRPALAANAGRARVLHAGTFSKLMFPAVRVAWLVVPSALTDTAHNCLRSIGGGHNIVAQAAVAELLDNGTISRHLQRARQIYAQRRQALLEQIDNSRILHTDGQQIGSLNLVLKLHSPVDRTALEAALNDHEVGAIALENLHWNRKRQTHCQALVLGLGNIESLQIPRTFGQLESAIAAAGRS
jgi:GntR family transcriptional regulator/MocR family aminotransferase